MALLPILCYGQVLKGFSRAVPVLGRRGEEDEVLGVVELYVDCSCFARLPYLRQLLPNQPSPNNPFHYSGKAKPTTEGGDGVSYSTDLSVYVILQLRDFA